MGAPRLRISNTVCFQQSSVLKVPFSGLLQVVYRGRHPADYHHAFILDLAFHENLALVNPVSMAATLRKTAPKAIEECHKSIEKQNPISVKLCFCNTSDAEAWFSSPRPSGFRLENRHNKSTGTSSNKNNFPALGIQTTFNVTSQNRPFINGNCLSCWPHGRSGCSRSARVVSQSATMEAQSPPKWQPRGAKRDQRQRA